MYVILQIYKEDEYTVVLDVVESYEILVNYVKILMERDATLVKENETLPIRPQEGYQIPIASNDKYWILFERHEYATVPRE